MGANGANGVLTAKDVALSKYHRLLVLGAPKVGKTTSVLRSCEKPAFVINCDDPGALLPALEHTTDFDWAMVEGDDLGSLVLSMDQAINAALSGKYKTIVWDTLSNYAFVLLTACADATRPKLPNGQPNLAGDADGRRYWDNYTRRLVGALGRLVKADAHLIAISHYAKQGAEMQGQVRKQGEGIAPNIAGTEARQRIPSLFQDIVFFEVLGSGKRVFQTSIEGVWGPGCRNNPGVIECEPDVSALWERMMTERSKVAKRAPATPAAAQAGRK